MQIEEEADFSKLIIGGRPLGCTGPDRKIRHIALALMLRAIAADLEAGVYLTQESSHDRG